MKNPENRTIVICGPTASGKTSLGVKIAEKYSGEILSADSRQVYKGMDIGTGKDLEEYKLDGRTIPYHLIDVANPEEIYNLYHYVNDFYKSFNETISRSNLPVVVGGTGLYLEAVIKHYRVPNVPENVELRKELMVGDLEKLVLKLKSLDDSIYCSTDLSSKKRVVRSIEVATFGQTNKLQWGGENPPKIQPLVLAVFWKREELIKRIDLRLNQRLEDGMVDEVESLLKSGVTHERMLLFGMEYKYISRYLSGELTYEEMVLELKTAIHRLSKRQMTWFRGMERRGLTVNWIENADFLAADKLIQNFLD